MLLFLVAYKPADNTSRKCMLTYSLPNARNQYRSVPGDGDPSNSKQQLAGKRGKKQVDSKNLFRGLSISRQMQCMPSITDKAAV